MSAFHKVYGVEHANPIDVLELARADAAANGHQEWASKLAQAKKDVEDLVKVSGNVLRADASRNNGAVMGEASLCRYFASGLTHTLTPFEVKS